MHSLLEVLIARVAWLLHERHVVAWNLVIEVTIRRLLGVEARTGSGHITIDHRHGSLLVV